MSEACPTCGCEMYNETGKCSGQDRIAEADKRVAELENLRDHLHDSMFERDDWVCAWIIKHAALQARMDAAEEVLKLMDTRCHAVLPKKVSEDDILGPDTDWTCGQCQECKISGLRTILGDDNPVA